MALFGRTRSHWPAAAYLLDDMALDVDGFLIDFDVGIFILISAVTQPMLRQAAM